MVVPRLAAAPAVLFLTLLAIAAGPEPADAPAASPAAPLQVLVTGDSLAVGMRPSFDALLAGAAVRWRVKSGITTPRGLVALRSALRSGPVPDVLVVSLGTNDGPDPQRFRDRIRRVLATVPSSTCVVWPTISRPPRKGAYRALNRVLRAEARSDVRLTLVSWDVAVRLGRVQLPDAVHPDAAGFHRRSGMVRAALARCTSVAAA